MDWKSEALYWKQKYIRELASQGRIESHDPQSHQKDWAHPESALAANYTEEELNAMCDAAEDKEKCREYNLREAEYYNKRAQLDAHSLKDFTLGDK